MKSEVINVTFVKHTGSDLWVIVECQYMKTVSLEIVSGVCIQCREIASYNTFSRAWLFLQHFDVRVYAFYYTRLIILSNFLISYKKTHTQKSMYINQESPVITATHCLYKLLTGEMKIRLGCLKCLLFLVNLVPRNWNLARVIHRVSLIYKIRQAVNWRANKTRPSSTWLNHGVCPSLLMTFLKSKAVVHWCMSFEVQLMFSSFTNIFIY